MQFQTVLTNAAPRIVNKRDGGQFTLYELFTQDGQTWVARQDVFNMARGFVGQPVEIVGRIEQNGNFTNYYVDMVTPLGAPQTNGFQGQGQTQYQPQPMQPNPVLQAQAAGAQAGRAPQPPMPVFPTEKDRCINRQTAGKVAAAVSSNATEFWANIQEIARYFDTGQIPGQSAGFRTTTDPGDYEQTPPHDDSDIPF